MILTNSGNPFKSENAARSAATIKKIEKYKIVPYENGYAIQEENAMEAQKQERPAQKRVSSEPWKPARVLDIPAELKNPAFTYRWCDKNKPGNIQKKLSEGWEIDTELSKKLTSLTKTIEDGSLLDGTTQMRELIVMRLPMERKIARQKYYYEKSNNKNIKEQFKQETGGLAYGEIKDN